MEIYENYKQCFVLDEAMKKTLMLILISICTYACDSRVGANADDDITAKVDTGVDCDTLAEWSLSLIHI